jgi:hypothetical protein
MLLSVQTCRSLQSWCGCCPVGRHNLLPRCGERAGQRCDLFDHVGRFANGNQDNDIPVYAFPENTEFARKARYWLRRTYYLQSEPSKPSVADIGAYWGGDLQGVIDKFDYLHWLGVTVVLLSPPFENSLGYYYGDKWQQRLPSLLGPKFRSVGPALRPSAERWRVPRRRAVTWRAAKATGRQSSQLPAAAETVPAPISCSFSTAARSATDLNLTSTFQTGPAKRWTVPKWSP